MLLDFIAFSFNVVHFCFGVCYFILLFYSLFRSWNGGKKGAWCSVCRKNIVYCVVAWNLFVTLPVDYSDTAKTLTKCLLPQLSVGIGCANVVTNKNNMRMWQFAYENKYYVSTAVCHKEFVCTHGTEYEYVQIKIFVLIINGRNECKITTENQ